MTTPSFKERVLSLVSDYAELRAQKDGAYAERNKCVGALVVLAMQQKWNVGIGLHDPSDIAWEAEWRNIVFIDLPTGQVSWHVHDSQMSLFRALPWYTGTWDGHSTPEKYRRLGALGAWFARGAVVDPACGSGNFLDAALEAAADAKEGSDV